MPSIRATSSACAKCRSSRRATASVSTWRICASCPVTPPTVSLPSTRKSSRMTRTNRHVHHMQPHFSPHFYSMHFSLTSLPSLALVLLLASGSRPSTRCSRIASRTRRMASLRAAGCSCAILRSPNSLPRHETFAFLFIQTLLQYFRIAKLIARVEHYSSYGIQIILVVISRTFAHGVPVDLCHRNIPR